MDPSNPSHIAKMFMDYMNDNMDEEIVRLFMEEEASSSRRPRRQRRDIERNCEEGHDRLFKDYFSKTPKCTVVIRILAYGTSTDNVDDYLRISETTTLKYVVSIQEELSSSLVHNICEGQMPKTLNA
ncbi:unnamed protein product [Lathyrus oleraceus]